MKQPEIIKVLADRKAAKDNRIDLDAYTMGVIDTVNTLKTHDCNEFVIRNKKLKCVYCGKSFKELIS